jgi:UDP-hydrolysing UDP-N-acetyl-D-glucosamine 2-epimerase
MRSRKINNKQRKIAIVTGTRSEYGILKPLLTKIQNSKELKLELIVTGMHLLKKYGLTVNEIQKDGFKIRAEIPMYTGDDLTVDYYGKALARGIDKFSSILPEIKPDILIVLGDRLEPLAAVLAASILRIPIGHIHGGDKTDSGHIDESIRHSITRFAHIHFAPTSKCEDRLFRMGEERWRIHNVGALGMDSIFNQTFINKENLFNKLHLDQSQKLILCIFHPVHLELENAAGQMLKILEVLAKLKIQTVIVYPNNDAGSRDIVLEIEKYKKMPFIKIFPSLSHVEYISLLKYADVLVGNSSSGIIEAPSMKLPVINIGSRNIGRERAKNVIFIDVDKNEIGKAINKALYDKEFRKIVEKSRNPYGNGKASDKIVKILSNIKIDKKLLLKKINY